MRMEAYLVPKKTLFLTVFRSVFGLFVPANLLNDLTGCNRTVIDR